MIIWNNVPSRHHHQRRLLAPDSQKALKECFLLHILDLLLYLLESKLCLK